MITVKQFIPALQFTSHAMATNDTRYFLNGVLLEVKDSTTIRLVGTDGHRIAKVDLESRDDEGVREHYIPEGQYILPADLVKDLIRSFKPKIKDPDYPVTVEIDSLDITISTPERRISGKLINGTFPDYTRVIPDLSKAPTTVGDIPVDWSDPKTREIAVNCTYLEQAFKACKFIANEVYHGIKLHMRGSFNSLVITIPDNSEYHTSGAVVVVMPMKI